MPNDLEAKSRVKINKLLEEAGWRFFDGEEGKANIHLESHIKFDDLGEDFEKIKGGFIDFLLLDDNQNPLVVLEAKSEKIEPLFAKEQARTILPLNLETTFIWTGSLLAYINFWKLRITRDTQAETMQIAMDMLHELKLRTNGFEHSLKAFHI